MRVGLPGQGPSATVPVPCLTRNASLKISIALPLLEVNVRFQTALARAALALDLHSMLPALSAKHTSEERKRARAYLPGDGEERERGDARKTEGPRRIGEMGRVVRWRGQFGFHWRRGIISLARAVPIHSGAE